MDSEKKRSCTDHVFVLNSIVKNRLNFGSDTFAAFLDLRKAFDYVNRDVLLYKIYAMGIDGKMYKSIKSLYENTKASVKLSKGLFTDWFETPSGVKQGDTLSPTLFSVFINDLFLHVDRLRCGIVINDRHISMLLYADDIVILAESEANLQKMLDAAAEWCSKWLLEINDKKSQIMHFRRKRNKRSDFNFSMGDSALQYTENYEYLGVYFNEHLDFNSHYEMVSASGKRALGSLVNKYRKNKHMTFSVYTKLFFSCVTPVLDYCSEVLGMYNVKEIDKVQVAAQRIFLGASKFGHQF